MELLVQQVHLYLEEQQGQISVLPTRTLLLQARLQASLPATNAAVPPFRDNGLVIIRAGSQIPALLVCKTRLWYHQCMDKNTKFTECKKCLGTGKDIHANTCKYCGGTGKYVKDSSTYKEIRE